MDFSTVIIILGCIIFLWIVGRIFSVPLKAIFKLIANSVLGGLIIFIINLVGSVFQFHIGLNIGTSFLVGILGIPRCHIINYFETVFMNIAIYIKTVYNTNVNSILSSYVISYEVLNKCTYNL